MKKNILEVCLSPDLGGLELMVFRYFESFSKRSLCKFVVAKDSKLDAYANITQKEIITRYKWFPFISAWKLAKIIDTNDINFIHFHWTKDMPIIILAKLFSKNKPSVMQSRHMTMTRFKDDFYHKWLYKNIDIIHAVTNQVKEQLIKYIPQNVRPKLAVVYPGIDEKQADKKSLEVLREKYGIKNKFIVGIVGRIEEGKGQYLVIEALGQLHDLDIQLLIVGHTMDEEYLKELHYKVKALNLEDKVTFTGFTKEVDAHMQLCDVVVLATQKETFGLVVIEAMMNKACMIAANSGGPLEIVEDDVTGMLFDRTREDLAKKIQELYEDKSRLELLSENGYICAKENFHRVIQDEKLYKIIDAFKG